MLKMFPQNARSSNYCGHFPWTNLLGATTLAAVFVITLPTRTHAYLYMNQTSYVNFAIPRSLYQPGGVDHVRASFGTPFQFHHGREGNLALPLVDAQSDLCTIPASLESSTSRPGQPFVLLADDSPECSYAHQVRTGQQLGASAVVLIYHSCLCYDASCADSPTCVATPPTMAASEAGSDDVSIPSVLIYRPKGQQIRNYLSKQQQSENNMAEETAATTVLVELAWHVPKLQTITVNYWYSLSSPLESQYILGNLSQVAFAFLDSNNHNNNKKKKKQESTIPKWHFISHVLLLNGTDLNRENEEDVDEMCTNHGRYCSLPRRLGDDDNDKKNIITGRQIVMETLRRNCLWKHLMETEQQDKASTSSQPQRQQELLWWQYIAHHVQHCQAKDLFDSPKCLQQTLQQLSTTNNKKENANLADRVESCMRDSGSVNDDVLNTILEDVLGRQKRHGIVQTPTLILNQSPVVGRALTIQTILEDLCQAYEPGFAPHICFACRDCGDPIACANRKPMKCLKSDGQPQNQQEGGDSKATKKKNSHGGRWFFIICLVSLGGFVYYKKQREDDGLYSEYTISETMFD